MTQLGCRQGNNFTNDMKSEHRSDKGAKPIDIRRASFSLVGLEKMPPEPLPFAL